MSLDVSLLGPPEERACEECGHARIVQPAVFGANITHNLTSMADAIDLYMPLWRPEECGIKHARQLIEPLRRGIDLLKSDRQRFEAYNPTNGWGSYDDFVPWLERYLEACEENPDAEVLADR